MPTKKVKYIAVVSYYKEYFDKWSKWQKKKPGEEYVWISKLNDIRGRNFISIIKLYKCYMIRNLDEIIEQLNLRIRK